VTGPRTVEDWVDDDWEADARAALIDALEDAEERHQQYLLRWDGDDG
jgi:hypothetical protein